MSTSTTMSDLILREKRFTPLVEYSLTCASAYRLNKAKCILGISLLSFQIYDIYRSYDNIYRFSFSTIHNKYFLFSRIFSV